MKLNNGLKFAGIGMALAVIVGCASVESVSKLTINNTKSGVIYGIANFAKAKSNDEKEDLNRICEAAATDERCLKKDEYKAVYVASKFGFSDAGVGVISLVEKDFDIGEGGVCGTGFSDIGKCTYVKAIVQPGKLGKIIAVVSRPGDNVCHWVGLPRAGGVVCEGLYDYRKDYNGIVR